MSASQNDANPLAGDGLPEHPPLRLFHVPRHDEADDWMGYESVHPLTWIPAPDAPAIAD